MDLATDRGQTPAGTLVLDFDGTVCLGDDPVRLYCQEVSRRLPPVPGEQVGRALERFLAGHRVEGLDEAQDGYQAVQRLASRAGMDTAALTAAYRASRLRFDMGEGRTWLPDGLLAELAGVCRRGVRVVLVTNAPLPGVSRFAARTGLAGYLDAVVADAGKPRGMGLILDRLLQEGGHPPARLLSLGDVWDNDIAPALERGCAGAFIDRFGRTADSGVASAPSVQGLYPVLRTWAGG